jgi:hypothetical protein
MEHTAAAAIHPPHADLPSRQLGIVAINMSTAPQSPHTDHWVMFAQDQCGRLPSRTTHLVDEPPLQPQGIVITHATQQVYFEYWVIQPVPILPHRPTPYLAI